MTSLALDASVALDHQRRLDPGLRAARHPRQVRRHAAHVDQRAHDLLGLTARIGAGDRGAGGVYADIDMTFGDAGYFHKDGTPYPTERIK